MFFSQLDFKSLRITVGPIKLKPFLSPGKVRKGDTSTSLCYEDVSRVLRSPGSWVKPCCQGARGLFRNQPWHPCSHSTGPGVSPPSFIICERFSLQPGWVQERVLAWDWLFQRTHLCSHLSRANLRADFPTASFSGSTGTDKTVDTGAYEKLP